MIREPLDPFSEVVDERRRWTPDWYAWLKEFVTQTVTITPQVPGPTGPLTKNLRFLNAPTTRIWVDIVAGNDSNDGLSFVTAKQTPQAAVDMVIKDFHLNNFAVEFFYVARFSGPNPVEYPGVIFAYPFMGSPHDFAITLRGQTIGGAVQVRIADGIAGCVHAAEGAQVYIHDIAVRSTAGGNPCLKAAYNGKLFLDNVVFYTGGGSMIEAGPRGGSIDINGPLSINQFGTDQSAGLTNSMDGGTIISAPGTIWTLVGSPQFSFGMLNASLRGYQDLRHTWAGAPAVGRKWTLQSDGMFVTGHPGAAGLDAWVPGSINGAMLDGGPWHIL